jgi:hypothetical protein
MTEDKLQQPLHKNRTVFAAVLMIISVPISGGIGESLSLPKPITSMLVWFVVGLISYWTIAVPNVSYLRWILVLEGAGIGWFIIFEVLRKAPKHWLPSYLTIGVACFLSVMNLYWVLHLLRIKKPMSFKVWALLSLAIGVGMSLMFVFMVRYIQSTVTDIGLLQPLI